MFDTLRCAGNLEKAGMVCGIAEAMSCELNSAFEENIGKRLSTIEADLGEVRSDLKLLKWSSGITLGGIVAVFVRSLIA